MRPIDADMLTEEIKSLSVTVTGLRAGKGILNEFMNEYRKSVIRTIDEQPSKQFDNGWIPVNERLPDENISPITQDYYYYECTFTTDRVTEVRPYKFGGGHWWHGGGCLDGYITAWRERPEPYKEDIDAERI